MGNSHLEFLPQARAQEIRPAKKNILFLFDRPIIPELGGVQRVTKNIADYLDGTGKFACFFLASPRWVRSGDTSSDSRQFVLPSSHFHASENRKFFEAFCVRNKISAVIHQSAFARAFPYVRECRRLNVPVISVFHQPTDTWRTKIEEFPRGFSLLKKLRAWRKSLHVRARYGSLCRDSSAVLVLSESERKNLCRYLPKKSDSASKIQVLPNMSSMRVADSGVLLKNKKELLFVDRIEFGSKRPDLLLKIWSRLEKRFPEWRMRLVGGGGNEDMLALKSLSEELGLERVSFEGFQKPEPFYRDAAIFCMTSAYEGFGMVLVEAAAFGCVPVAFDSFAAVHDIIADGENGRIVPAFDLDKYAETLAELMSDSALRERLARAAQRGIERFSPAKIGAAWEKLLAEAKPPRAMNRE